MDGSSSFFSFRVLLLTLSLFFITKVGSLAETEDKSTGGVSMKIISAAFEHNKYIPEKYSCQGSGVNPPLEISGIPLEAKSLALIMDDPDAPMGTFDHWIVFDIRPEGRIEENSAPGIEGTNTIGENNYVPPCPPSGTHRYFFKVYALDCLLGLEGSSTDKKKLEDSMKGHILASAELIGLYKKK
jgi:hypothetical protein